MRKIYALLLCLSALSFSASATLTLDAAPAGGGDSTAVMTVMEVISNHANLGVFAALLDTADLDVLLMGDGPFTVFAPVDVAVDQLDPLLIITLVMDPAAMAGVISYHIAETTLLTSDMTDGQSVDTMTDDDLILSLGDATILVNNYAAIIEGDLEASNGVVHVIDQVLFPEQSVDDMTTTTFAAYPNPVQDELWIASTIQQTLEVHDATGRLLHTINMQEAVSRQRLSTTAWPAGVLFISDADGRVIRIVNN
ncbi:MAG: fasciclin domain-containing protein [Flavobacteriales bacterium]|nr:fasciclin domain-containing protein [Flavobacteriales bacterium]